MGSEEKPLVFISCGQFTDDEISLGKAVESLIQNETSFDAYFAEQQNSLDGLTTNILSNLNRAAGFIAIMHHRGEFDTPHEHLIRASVWVEQEIAIAAFIQHVLGRRIEVAVYIQRGISREGIRQQLRLKPVEFDQSDEVLADLRKRVKSWAVEATSPQPLQAEWRFEYLRPPASDRHDYRLTVELVNTGSSVIAEWMAEVWFPSQFMEGARSSEGFKRFRTDDSEKYATSKRIFPGDRLRVFGIQYFVTNENWPGWYEGERPMPTVRIRVSAANQKPWQVEIPFMKIQHF
ncbi:MAG TPA: hypothetical protein VNG71_16950 [Pyrinomonadaceae bacterium]|nr:hypothetical protein [Pyrinomonadaceae bacterium]